MGPCLCGDTHCAHCGPLQGNYRCPYCKHWTDEGGCPDPAACDAAEEAEILTLNAQQLEELEHGPEPDVNEPCPTCGRRGCVGYCEREEPDECP